MSQPLVIYHNLIGFGPAPFRYDNFRFAAEALKVKEQAGHQYSADMSFVRAFFSLADRDWFAYIPLTSHGDSLTFYRESSVMVGVPFLIDYNFSF